VGSVADAEDVCQEAFLTALQRLEDCRRPERFRAWLLTIVRNRARDLLRSGAVRQALPLESAASVAGGESPFEAAHRVETRERLEAALRELPAVQREVLLLHDLEGWRHREIGELLGMPEGTVRAHLFHARRGVRERLGAGLRRTD
jgi:RNA polymerase sigma-70 factor (ECF subfamily)